MCNFGSQQPSKSNWRLKHEELIQSLRAAKQAQHAIATGQPLPPPPPPSLNPGNYCINELFICELLLFKNKRVPARLPY